MNPKLLKDKCAIFDAKNTIIVKVSCESDNRESFYRVHEMADAMIIDSIINPQSCNRTFSVVRNNGLKITVSNSLPCQSSKLTQFYSRKFMTQDPYNNGDSKRR